ncbi:MAG: phage baseplate protein [Blautia massiliensis (ex Durand et al. 2017)]
MSKTENIIAQVLERMLPVGSIVEWSPVDGGKADLSTPEKVAAYYGFGTWEAYGSGQMLLGVSDSHGAGSTGGEEKHTLTQSEVASHYHTVNDVSRYGDAGITGWNFTPDSNGTWHAASVNTTSSGSNEPHNNMPPYITVYRWRRIA